MSIKKSAVISSKRSTSSKRAARSAFDYSSVRGEAVALKSVDFNYVPVDDEKGYEYFVTCGIENYVAELTRSVGICNFTISQRKNKELLSNLKARYLYIVSSDKIESEQAREEVLKLFANLSLFPRFKNLFGLINYQSDASLPRLPMKIVKIKYEDLSKDLETLDHTVK